MSATLPEPDPVQTPGQIEAPFDVEPAPDAKPKKRPTTRAGRRAAAEARKAQAAATGKPAPDRKPRGPAKPTKANVKASVEQLHSMLGMLALPILGLPETGAALAAAGPEAGDVWAEAVQRYPALEKIFGAGTDGLIIFRLLMVYAPLVTVAMAEKSAPKSPAAGGPLDLDSLRESLTG